MSTFSAATFRPAARAEATTSSAAAALSRKKNVTSAPCAANSSTIARPMPRLPPVTIATLSASPPSIVFIASARDCEAAVDDQRMAGDHVRLGQAEQIHRAGDVLRRERRAGGRALREVGE